MFNFEEGSQIGSVFGYPYNSKIVFVKDRADSPWHSIFGAITQVVG